MTNGQPMQFTKYWHSAITHFSQLLVAILNGLCFREVKDSRFIPEKMSTKHAKELFDTNNEYEIKYKRFFSGKPAFSGRIDYCNPLFQYSSQSRPQVTLPFLAPCVCLRLREQCLH